MSRLATFDLLAAGGCSARLDESVLAGWRGDDEHELDDAVAEARKRRRRWKARARTRVKRREAMSDEAVTLRCHYCGCLLSKTTRTKDHIVPLAVLGRTVLANNYVDACQPCNQDKGSKMPVCGCGRCRAAVTAWRSLQEDSA